MLRTEQDVSRNDRRSGDMVAKDLDVLVIVIGSFIDIADSTAIQENVCEFMNEGKNSPVDAVLDVELAVRIDR